MEARVRNARRRESEAASRKERVRTVESRLNHRKCVEMLARWEAELKKLKE